MKPKQEIAVKFVILTIILVLLIVQILVINIRIVAIVITIIALILTIVIIVVEMRKGKRLCHAFIYKHKENGHIRYCENDQGDDTLNSESLEMVRYPVRMLTLAILLNREN